MPLCWFLLKISSTLKMEAICSSETSVASQQTTQRHIPEDVTIQLKRILKLGIMNYVSHILSFINKKDAEYLMEVYAITYIKC
jgi:hypothetical protein